MSYNDDEELKIGEIAEEDDDLGIGPDADGPIDDDILGNDDDLIEGFADIDGSSY